MLNFINYIVIHISCLMTLCLKAFIALEDNSNDPLTLVWCTNVNGGAKSNYLAFYFILG
jgi:hypothetical protein